MHSKNYTLIILSVLLVVLVAPLFAQNSGYWTALETTQLTSRQVQPDIQPLKYKAFSLDQIKLDQLLGQAPERFSSYEEDEVIIELPMPDGSFQHFQVEYAPVMHPDLAARYPNIRTYVAYGIEDPQAYARLDYSPYGFHAQVFNHQKGSILVDPFSSVQTDYYISYYKKDYQSEIAFHCGTETVVNKITEAERLTSARAAGDCDLRKYRLALSCTGEYASFHGGTVSSTLAAMNTAMARVNGIYERDFGITMELIANNDELIFLNAGSDPFTNGSGGAMLGQNQSTIDDIIGTSNYDIGHVFSTGGGGIAGLGVVCSSSRKAQGVTGLSSPINDPFYVDYVAHEIGHQFGGNHTQNNRCNSVSSTSMEPGSASTIMGYAGICAPNVQFNSDDYFHAISIQEIVNYSNSDQGDSCPEKISTGNNLPTVDAGSDYIIPISTPFALTANGDDEDGDALTYCWEQMDPQEASMPPSSSSSAGPLFRSYSPVASPTRYFPRLPDLINNFDSDWEELPGVNRTMNFRCTVRDNHLGNGCTAEDDLVLTVIASAGPFLVQSPNTALTWIVGTTETVTWDVANTNSLPVSCAAMDILLSTDGGLTYPTVLAEGVPNNGMADIVVPNMVGDQNRVMVLCASNVFFDISNTDFSIEVPPNPTFTLNLNPSSLDICGGETANYNLNLGSLVGFNQPVQLSALGLPAGANIDFSVNPVTSFPTDVQVSISNLTAATGLYTFQIIGTSGNIELNQTADLNLYNGIPIASQLLSPADGEEGVNLETVLTWDLQNDAQSYEIEIASNPNFGSSILETATVETNTYTPENLGTFQVYFWRVKAINPCGESTFSATFAFQTLGNACFDYSSTNVPIEIPANTAVAVSSNLTIDDELTISDINVQTNLSHTWVGDISMELISPEGTTINLMDRPGVPGSTYGCNQDDISVVFDDEAILTADDLEAACEDNGTAIEGSYRPIDPLSTLVGKEAEGNWLLIVEDAVEEDGGALDSWQLEICVQQQSGILTFLYRSPLRVEQGSSKELDEFILSLFSSSSSNEDITFLITDLTDHGEIRRDGQPLGLSETFTQAEINNGQIEYVHDGSMTTSDELRFDVFDTGGGWLRDEFLQITIFDNSGQPGPSVIVVNEIACHGETGAIFYVDVFGGLPPYEYQLEGITDYQEENIFADLPAGTYTILVRDANNQIGELNDILVAQPEPIELSATVNFRNITAMASGGTGAFQYSLDQVDYQSSPEFTNLPNGSYKIYAQDMNACLDSTEVEVNVAALIIESVSTLNTACFDTEDGNLSVEMVSGGVPPYTYSLNGGPFQTESIFDNIGSGEYTLTVRDDTGEEVTDTYTIESPDELMISVQTVDNSIIVSASGGTGSLFYSLDEGITLQEDSVFNDLPNDTYIVTVVDDNGCTISTEVVIDIVDITEIPGLSFSIFPNPSNAVFQVDIQAATGAVEMRLYDALGRQLQFAELGTGQHIIDMNDQSGGIYFLQMSHQSKSLVRQLVLIK